MIRSHHLIPFKFELKVILPLDRLSLKTTISNLPCVLINTETKTNISGDEYMPFPGTFVWSEQNHLEFKLGSIISFMPEQHFIHHNNNEKFNDTIVRIFVPRCNFFQTMLLLMGLTLYMRNEWRDETQIFGYSIYRNIHDTEQVQHALFNVVFWQYRFKRAGERLILPPRSMRIRLN